MSGIAIAALTMPGSVAPLAICWSDASLRIDSMRRSSATTRPGTRMPRSASWEIRQRYGPTRSRCIQLPFRLPRGWRCRAAVRPGDPGHRDQHADDARDLWDTERAEPEAVESERLDGEAADRVEADVGEEQRPRARGKPRTQPSDEQQKDPEVPERLVEEGRVKVLELGVAERTVLRRDGELPRQVGRTTEGLLVEEVPPAADRLPEHHRRCRDVEPAQDRQVPPVREPQAEERAHDQAAVHGEPALPDGDDLRRVTAVVIPVEDHFVEACADEAGQDGPLSDADDVVGGQPLAPGLAVAEPEPDDDRRRHENAVPADDDRAELEGDRARRAHREREHAPEDTTEICEVSVAGAEQDVAGAVVSQETVERGNVRASRDRDGDSIGAPRA